MADGSSCRILGYIGIVLWCFFVCSHFENKTYCRHKLPVCIPANSRSTKIWRRLEIFRGSQQNRVSNSEEPLRAVASRLYLGLYIIRKKERHNPRLILSSGSVTQKDKEEVCFIFY